MRSTLCVLLSILWIGLFGLQAFGQESRRIEFGLTAGVPVDHVLRYEPNQYEGLFSLVDTHDDDSFPIVIGPMVDVNITKYVAFEAAALYRPIHLYELYVPIPIITSVPSVPTITQGSWWEFPLLAKIRFPGKTVHPFTKVGMVPHTEHASSGYYQITSRTGFALGGGVEWKVRRMTIVPELRYSHWTKQYSNLGWSATPDRIDLLVGFSFH